MSTSSERQEMIAMIRRLPEVVEAAVKELSDAQLDTPYGEGKWTVRQVVHHLADSHMNAFVRMKLMLTEETPTLKTYSQDRWARLPDCTSEPIAPSLAILRGMHQRWCNLMDKLGDSEWRRTAMHPERGTITLDDILGIYARHGENHVGRITSLRKARGW